MQMSMKKKKENNGRCSDCGVELVRNCSEYMCPKCGLVEELVE
jgi:predicted RNA-binding Zn-ribbon protein involved in translation (DUF1610 family)